MEGEDGEDSLGGELELPLKLLLPPPPLEILMRETSLWNAARCRARRVAGVLARGELPPLPALLLEASPLC